MAGGSLQKAKYTQSLHLSICFDLLLWARKSAGQRGPRVEWMRNKSYPQGDYSLGGRSHPVIFHKTERASVISAREEGPKAVRRKGWGLDSVWSIREDSAWKESGEQRNRGLISRNEGQTRVGCRRIVQWGNSTCKGPGVGGDTEMRPPGPAEPQVMKQSRADREARQWAPRRYGSC